MTLLSGSRRVLMALAALLAAATLALDAQQQQQQQRIPPERPLLDPDAKPAPAERLGPGLFRIGTVTVDTARKEVTANGTVQDAMVLEFLAVSRGGFKAYESVLELDTTAINFNVALLLAGVDPDRGVVPKIHLDPNPPAGDPLEIWVEWQDGGAAKRVRAEQLIYNRRTQTTLPDGPWVYTGGMRLPNGRYLWEAEGTLISFVHTNAPLIDSPRPLVAGGYGDNILNPALNLKSGAAVKLIVRALPR